MFSVIFSDDVHAKEAKRSGNILRLPNSDESSSDDNDGYDDFWEEEDDETASQSSEMVFDETPFYANQEEDPEVQNLMYLVSMKYL